MKFFVVVLVVVALAGVAQADDSLTGALGPLLALLQPLLTGLNIGMQAGAGKIGRGLNQVGNAAQNVVSGVGTIAGNTAAGLGGTVSALPGALGKTTRNLQGSQAGLVGGVLDNTLGANSRHSSSQDYC